MIKEEARMKKFEKYINTFDLIEWIINTFPNWCEGDVRQIVDYIEGLEDRSVGEWEE